MLGKASELKFDQVDNNGTIHYDLIRWKSAHPGAVILQLDIIGQTGADGRPYISAIITYKGEE